MYQREDKVNITFGQLTDLYNRNDSLSVNLIYGQHLRNECYKPNQSLKECPNEEEVTTKFITINGQTREVKQEAITRNQIINLAFDYEYGTMSDAECNRYTLIYRIKNKEGWEKSGTLCRGETIKVVDGMRFDVADCSNA